MQSEKEQYYIHRILEVLLEKEIVTNSVLSEITGLAERSVRMKLSVVEGFLKEKKLGSIERKPRIGIWLQADEQQRKKIRQYITPSEAQDFIPGNEERQDEILRLIFQMKKNRPMTIANLADKLYLSIPTTKNCFNQVVDWFAERKVTVKTVRNKGICLECEEADYRKACRQYIMKKHAEELEQAMEGFFPGLDTLALRKILLKIEARWRLEFSDYSLREIWLYLCVAVYRIRNGYVMTEVSDEKVYEVSKHKEYEFSLAIFEVIAEQMKMELPISEVVNLAEVILCANVISDGQGEESLDIFQYDSKLKEFVKEIIVCMSVILGEDLTDDSILYKGLLQHIRPAIFRMRYGYENPDEMLSYVKKEYKKVYRAAWATSPLFEEYFDVKVTDAELIYVTLYVQVALERRARPFTAALVTPDGNGYAQLLCMRIKKAVPRITEIKMVRRQDFKQEDLHCYNVVFTTSDYPEEGRNVVRVPKVLTDEAEMLLKRKVRKIAEVVAKKEERLDISCYSLLNPEMMIMQSDLTDKEEILKVMTGKLEEAGYVTKNYYKTVLEREKMTTTAIGNGVAIPHGYAAGVNQSKVCICTLKNPIRWNDEMVDVIFLLAVKMKTQQELKDIQLFYKYFIKLTDTDEKVNILRKIGTGTEMYKYLIS